MAVHSEQSVVVDVGQSVLGLFVVVGHSTGVTVGQSVPGLVLMAAVVEHSHTVVVSFVGHSLTGSKVGQLVAVEGQSVEGSKVGHVLVGTVVPPSLGLAVVSVSPIVVVVGSATGSCTTSTTVAFLSMLTA